MTADERTDQLLRTMANEGGIGGLALALRPIIADTIRAIVADERGACARLAEALASHHQTCPTDCRCGDGWHIAAAIRDRGDA